MVCFVEQAKSGNLAPVKAFPFKFVDHLCDVSWCTRCIVAVHITSCPALNLFKCKASQLQISFQVSCVFMQPDCLTIQVIIVVLCVLSQKLYYSVFQAIVNGDPCDKPILQILVSIDPDKEVLCA